MNPTKLKNYCLTGSIHTLEVKSYGLVEPEKDVSKCIKCSTSSRNEEVITSSIMNPNKMFGDIYSYSEFKTVFDTILLGSGIDSYKMVRTDFRMDNYNPEHYKDFSKLNRYLISAMAITYKTKNCYRATNLFSEQQLSIAIKNRYFELENYDKKSEQEESNGTDPAMSRLEMRSKNFQDNDIEKEFVEHWFKRWDKAIKNLDKVQEKYNDELVRIYEENKSAYPKQFMSIREFIMQYQNCIFAKKQMVDLLTRIGDCENPEEYAKKYKSRYGIEYFSYSDVEYAVNEIKRAVLEFFNN